ncbi:MATE family efflux transporter [Alicyclobacillus acidoterrestris]|nr:MATE family efflux transporter [Alicyclobacillus acidoterrestris]
MINALKSSKGLEISKEIYRIAMPITVSSAVDVLVQVLNTLFVGYFPDPDALYIISLYLPLSFLLVSISEAFQISIQVSVARRASADDAKTSVKSSVTSWFLMSIAASVFIAVLVSFTISGLINFFHVNPAVRQTFVLFVKGMAWTAALVQINLLISSIMRGYGRVRFAMLLNLAYAVTNIAAVFIFGFVVKSDVFSLVYANLATSSVFIIIGLIALVRLGLASRPLRHQIINRETLVTLLRIGIPVALSYLLIFLSTSVFTRIVVPFGHDAVAGFGVSYRIQTFVMLPALSFGYALGILVNQWVGRKEFERAYRGVVYGIRNVYLLYLVLASALYVLIRPLTDVSTSSGHVATYIYDYLHIVTPSYVLMGATLTSLMLLEQLNRGFVALMMNAIYFLGIGSIGWVLTTQYHQLNLFFWTIAGANVFGISAVFVARRICKRILLSTTAPSVKS